MRIDDIPNDAPIREQVKELIDKISTRLTTSSIIFHNPSPNLAAATSVGNLNPQHCKSLSKCPSINKTSCPGCVFYSPTMASTPNLIFHNPSPNPTSCGQCPHMYGTLPCLNSSCPNYSFISYSNQGQGHSGVGAMMPIMQQFQKVKHVCDRCGGWEETVSTYHGSEIIDIHLAACESSRGRDKDSIDLCYKCYDKVFYKIMELVLGSDDKVFTDCKHIASVTPVLGKAICKLCGKDMP